MRIVVVAPCPFPALRGSQVLIRQLAEALAARDHEVHIVCYSDGGEVPVPPRVRIHRAGRSLRGLKPWLPWIVWKGLNDLALAWRLRCLLRETWPDVIHAHNYEGPLVAWLARWPRQVPVVYHAHNVLCDELPTYARTALGRRLWNLVGAWLDRKIPPRAQLVVSLSVAQGSYLKSCGVAESRLLVCPPPRPWEVSPPADRLVASRSAAHWIVGYAGNFDAYQDLQVLAKAVERIRRTENVTLLLVTHEPRAERELPSHLRRLVAQGAARIVWVAGVAETMEVLGRAHVLVCPRSSWSGFPIKLVNYAALGKPILLSESVARSLRWPELAGVFPDRNPVALARLLREFRRSQSLQQKLMTAAHQFWLSLPEYREVGEWLEQAMARVASVRSLGLDPCQNSAGRHLGVDSHRASSYKPADGSREGDARA